MQIRAITQVALFSAIMVILSWIPPIPMPFSPVPITFQVLGALLAGSLLGAKYGALSQCIYLFLGAIGLPIFSGGMGGISVLLGPTGGYLFGFVFAAAILGYLLNTKRTAHFPETAKYIFGMFLAIAAIYLPGTIWLSQYMQISFSHAAAIGTLPYIPFDLIKAAIATIISIPLRQRLKSLNMSL